MEWKGYTDVKRKQRRKVPVKSRDILNMAHAQNAVDPNRAVRSSVATLKYVALRVYVEPRVNRPEWTAQLTRSPWRFPAWTPRARYSREESGDFPHEPREGQFPAEEVGALLEVSNLHQGPRACNREGRASGEQARNSKHGSTPNGQASVNALSGTFMVCLVLDQ